MGNGERERWGPLTPSLRPQGTNGSHTIITGDVIRKWEKREPWKDKESEKRDRERRRKREVEVFSFYSSHNVLISHSV